MYNKVQSHSLLAKRIQEMINALWKTHPKTEEQQRALRDLEEQQIIHERAAKITGDEFITT